MNVVALDESTAPAWQALFEACGSTCFCRYWHFVGSKSEWLLRGATEPDTNRDEQRALVRAGAPEASGLLAMEGERAVGWMKLTPRRTMTKLLRQGAYRPLDLGSNDGVWSIGCLLVLPGERRTGIASRLIESAPSFAQVWDREAHGETKPCVVEAYPRGDALGRAHDLHDEEAWMGTVRLYETCGFVRFAGEDSYPVMRKTAQPPLTRT